MNANVQDLLEKAKGLAREDQVLLSDALHDLVDPPDKEWESAWLAECGARLAAYERGEMAAEDFDAVVERLKAKHAPT